MEISRERACPREPQTRFSSHEGFENLGWGSLRVPSGGGRAGEKQDTRPVSPQHPLCFCDPGGFWAAPRRQQTLQTGWEMLTGAIEHQRQPISLLPRGQQSAPCECPVQGLPTAESGTVVLSAARKEKSQGTMAPRVSRIGGPGWDACWCPIAGTLPSETSTHTNALPSLQRSHPAWDDLPRRRQTSILYITFRR